MFKIVKKDESSKWQSFKLRILAVFGALIASSVIMLAFGYNPIEIYYKIIEGSTQTKYRLIETFNKTIPLIVLSLGIAVAFKMKFWNIGAEGQFYMGAFGAALIAFTFKDLPMIIMLPAMAVSAGIFGGLCAFIPGILKAKFNTSETLVTLMLNYIVIRWISYLQYGPWKDPAAKGFARIARFTEAAVLPKLFGVHIGWIIALILSITIFILFNYTKLGYEITVIGENVKTAQYAGINVNKTIVLAVIISGGICGIAGMMQASAIERSLSEQLSGGLGFTAIITTWLAQLSPIGIIITSFLFAMLLQGGAYLQSALQIPSAVADILQGAILFFVLSSEFFTKYRILTRKHLEKETIGLQKGGEKVG
ncbi:hypothetical protein SDC9_99677 [bioreactor metagenome]|uniref:Uncharacterized protein n=1 Tax=bioreactor metagenome TaxID=1076179 RepID=A0A645APX3_9ZZZZ